MANPFSFKTLQRSVDLQERYRGQKRRTVYKTDDKGQLVKTSLLEPKQRSTRRSGRRPR
jgi:hypothetical protein